VVLSVRIWDCAFSPWNPGPSMIRKCFVSPCPPNLCGVLGEPQVTHENKGRCPKLQHLWGMHNQQALVPPAHSLTTMLGLRYVSFPSVLLPAELPLPEGQPVKALQRSTGSHSGFFIYLVFFSSFCTFFFLVDLDLNSGLRAC
jgi:hypothetical protein